METLSDRSAKYLGGDFEEQYRRYVDAIAATNKQAKVSSTTRVVGAAVESLRGGATGTEATAIVYTNTTSTTPQTLNFPSMKYLSYRLDLKRFGRDWRVTKMTTITSLDLTPKL
jgi:Mce-associated membrane protein